MSPLRKSHSWMVFALLLLSFIKSNYLKPLNFVEVKIYSPQNSEVQKTRYINYSHNKFILFFFIKFVQKCDVSNKIMWWMAHIVLLSAPTAV